MKTNHKILSVIILILLYSCSVPKTDKEIVSLEGSTMGTFYTIKIAVENMIDGNEYERLQTEIDSVLEKVNAEMSTYIPTSEISMFNKSISTDWQTISPDFHYVLSESIKLGYLSAGALDITIAPLVNLWGFGTDDFQNNIPSSELINEILLYTGIDKLQIDTLSCSIRKKEPRLNLDLSATAKGFGVDKIYHFLLIKGYKNLLIEIGGELRSAGLNHLNKKWAVGISKPSRESKIQEVVELSNMAMATSGDYWNYFEVEGKRYSHTIDPRTGAPVTHNLASVTVIDTSCLRADALATAIEVLGPEEGMKFANDKELIVYMIVRNKKSLEIFKTPGFSSYIRKEK